ncbi:MAG: hypothetical protein IKV40_01360 [Clostridia bacterium]|nr:hypothetical protein [Clostridia bacterium]
MKNLRKIFVAIAVLALLVSSVTVLVVTADDEAIAYTGELSKAKELLADVPAMDRTDSTTDLRKEAIKKVYNYIRSYPIDPETEGYAEFYAEFYAMSTMILNKYYEKFVEAPGEATLEVVLSYVNAFLIPSGTPDPDGDGDKYISYDEIVKGIATEHFKLAETNHDKVTEALSAAASTKTKIKDAMNNSKALYVFLSKYPVFDSIEGKDSFTKSYNETSLKITEFILKGFADYRTSGDDAGYKSDLSVYLTLVKDHIVNSPVDIEAYSEFESRYNAITPAINKAELDQIGFLLDDFTNFDGSGYEYPELAEAAALSKVSNALSSSTIPESTEGYAEIVNKIRAEEVRIAGVKEARRLELEGQSKLAEYDMTSNMYFYDFTADTEKMGNPNSDANEYSERAETADGNKYWRYVCLASPASPASYASLTQTYIKNGFVMSFDFMAEGTNGTHFNKATFSNEWQKSDGGRLENYGKSIFEIAYDASTDALMVYNVKKTGIETATTVKNVAAEGQWFNVMFTFDYNTRYGKLYIDYQYMFDVYLENGPDNAVRTTVRCSHSSSWQNVCYDNLSFYEGTTYRDMNKFKGKSNVELFNYYVDYFNNDEYDVDSRNTAYTKAKLLIDSMRAQVDATPEEELTDELKAVKKNIEIYDNFDFQNELKGELVAQNLATILSMVDELKNIAIDSSKVSDINKKIAAIDTFIANNNDFINKADSAYNAAMADISAVKVSLSKCQTAVDFAKLLIQFNRATTVASMTKRLVALDELYKSARMDKEENISLMRDDSAFISFEALINPGGAVRGDKGYVTALDYYFAIPEKIAEQAKVENSNRIIKCIELLLDLEGYENTEEYWLEHYDEVEFFVSIIRDIVSVDNYDPTYVGVDEALLQYEEIEAFFFDILQATHIEIISAQLDRFAESISYIEKMGICQYLDTYFASNNDIDLTLPEIQEFVYRLERYKKELDGYADTYNELLERNTRYFIDTVNKMKTLTSYADLKPLYETALSYYYAMNAITDEAKEAVALFDEYDKALISIETNAKLFMTASADIDFAEIFSIDMQFQMLSECALYYDYIDKSYSDALASRMAKYEALLDAYNGAVDSVNASAETSMYITSALRADSIPSAVLAVIITFYMN